MLWLRNTNNVPPGEFYYRQNEAGQHTFGPSPLIGSVTSDLSAFRKANNLPRSSAAECLEDIIRFTVSRLDPRSEWVMETDVTVGELIRSPATGCSSCGAKL